MRANKGQFDEVLRRMLHQHPQKTADMHKRKKKVRNYPQLKSQK